VSESDGGPVAIKHVAVLDVGKTNAKVAVVDLTNLTELTVRKAPNAVLPGPPYPHVDTDALWAFFRTSLCDLGRDVQIDGLAVTAHGACGVLLTATGDLAAPVLDYEFDGPEETRKTYDGLRPDFAETGSPNLRNGLTLGAQIHWQLSRDPDLRRRISHVVTWPQYWTWRLTGKRTCDISSLGCHTDLWNPHLGTWSSLPDRLGLAGRFASPTRPGEIIGTLTPALQTELGLRAVPVLCGIHDSNASLVPHLLQQEPPFAVVSTGTWVVAMAVGGARCTLDPSRDTLINVSAFGDAVPSARFMGGREFDLVAGGELAATTEDSVRRVLDSHLMLLPAVVSDSGPFRGCDALWSDAPPDDATLHVALAFYLALMTAACLRLIGAAGPTLVEGPLARNPLFCRMLQSSTERPLTASAASTGTAVGAALLFSPRIRTPQESEAQAVDPRMLAYARRWTSLADRRYASVATPRSGRAPQ